jgi:hypothetical protein
MAYAPIPLTPPIGLVVPLNAIPAAIPPFLLLPTVVLVPTEFLLFSGAIFFLIRLFDIVTVCFELEFPDPIPPNAIAFFFSET